ncbi:MAG: Proteasome subunit beta precursor [Candidatus Lokiarchaeum sp. GC14_75]|nr:MAG: Proteasome subunit beta precursor [Candidatus Lokiarchaeum sp. GC14_75]
MINNNIDHRFSNDKEFNKAIQTGTTTVGIIVKGGVIIGTESQASAGTVVASKQAQKLFEINKFTAATIAGGVADCQYVVNQLRALSKLKEVEEGIVPEPKYITSVTRNILFSGRSFFMSMMIIGGYSVIEKSGKLSGIDMLGTLYEEDSFLSFGSGSPFSLGVLEADWKPNMTKEEGIEIIKTAISSSRTRDAGSGYELQICSIDKNGFVKID